MTEAEARAWAWIEASKRERARLRAESLLAEARKANRRARDLSASMAGLLDASNLKDGARLVATITLLASQISLSDEPDVTLMTVVLLLEKAAT